MKILITAGGTEEPIDGVRSISNFSTGRTGAFLANFLAEQGTEVTLLRASSAVSAAVETKTFVTTGELQNSLQLLLSTEHYDVVIHAAAVSDYHVAAIESGGKNFTPDKSSKIDSSEDVTLKLARNPKLIDSLKTWSCNPDIRLIGFKLTRGITAEEVHAKVQKLFGSSKADMVVHNDLSAMNEETHPFTLYTVDSVMAQGNTKQEMATAIYKELTI